MKWENSQEVPSSQPWAHYSCCVSCRSREVHVMNFQNVPRLSSGSSFGFLVMPCGRSEHGATVPPCGWKLVLHVGKNLKSFHLMLLLSKQFDFITQLYFGGGSFLWRYETIMDLILIKLKDFWNILMTLFKSEGFFCYCSLVYFSVLLLSILLILIIIQRHRKEIIISPGSYESIQKSISKYV